MDALLFATLPINLDDDDDDDYDDVDDDDDDGDNERLYDYYAPAP